MDKSEFVEAVFRIAQELGLTINQNRHGRRRIWFNENSQKYLWHDQIAALHPALLQDGLSVKHVRDCIEAVAPGRPCTHAGMRKIAEVIRAEIAQRQ